MTRPTMLFCAALCAAAAPAALAGGPGCGCAAPVVPGATVDLEFAGCPCAAAPACAAPACAAPVYGYGDACGCDNRNYAVRPGSGMGSGFTGGLRRLWDLEKRKNAWLKKTFIDGPKGRLCGLQDDCAPVCGPVCGPTCDVSCAAPAYAPADCGCVDGGCGAVAEPACAAPACAAPVYVDPTCAAPVAVPGCAAPAFAAPTCGCN